MVFNLTPMRGTLQKKWSLFARWNNPELKVTQGIVQFLWIEDDGGYQIDYTMEWKELARYRVSEGFINVDTFNQFVRWAYGCVQDMDGEFVTMPGCPQCGTILNAQTANCNGLYHMDNQPSVMHLTAYLEQHFPRALKMAHGDAVLAALNLINVSTDLVSAMAPIIGQAFTSVLQQLEAAGVAIPTELLKGR